MGLIRQLQFVFEPWLIAMVVMLGGYAIIVTVLAIVAIVQKFGQEI